MRIEQEELLDILNYDPNSGEFVWKHSSPTTKAGEVAGKIYQNGYRYIAIANTYYPAALLAWIYITGQDPGGIIDHKNSDKLDDRFINLRPATHSQNHANIPKPKHNKSGIKGVFWNSQKRKWHARITIDYKTKHIGFFDDIVDAALAYRSAAIATWGEFANLPSAEEIQKVAKSYEISAEEIGL